MKTIEVKSRHMVWALLTTLLLGTLNNLNIIYQNNLHWQASVATTDAAKSQSIVAATLGIVGKGARLR